MLKRLIVGISIIAAGWALSRPLNQPALERDVRIAPRPLDADRPPTNVLSLEAFRKQREETADELRSVRDAVDGRLRDIFDEGHHAA